MTLRGLEGTPAGDQLKAFNGFLGKTDGRDKLCATVQYVLMFIANGEPGYVRKAMASVAAARKVFRVFRPLENITPLVLQPTLLNSKPLHTQVLDKAKALLNAVYFSGDHVVWASQAGIYSNKEVIDRAQKVSLWAWFGASTCTIVNEVVELSNMAPRKRLVLPGEDEVTFKKQQAAELAATRKRVLVLFHAWVQAMLAVGLLQLRPWKPRFVGFLGTVASLLNCYMLFPALPAPAAKKTATAPALARADEAVYSAKRELAKVA